jgi:hypothetical protein
LTHSRPDRDLAQTVWHLHPRDHAPADVGQTLYLFLSDCPASQNGERRSQGGAVSVTLEWIRLPKNLAAYVIGKSSWGRRGLIIATATGVHPGFKGCLTLELSNVGELPIAIKPGMNICQLFLHKVETENDELDKSLFIGLRRPTIGKLQLDPIARKLADAYSSKASTTTP